MTNKETIERNIGLTFDFLRQVLNEPSMLDEIPNGAVIDFVEKDFAKRESKTSLKPTRYLRVKSQFELVGQKIQEPTAPYNAARRRQKVK